MPDARYSSVDTGGLAEGKRRATIEGRTAISSVTAVPALRRDGDDITDHDLVARVRAGDDRAFERLYTRYHRRIASYIQGMVHDHARAEDIAQDVFMSALRRMRETDRPIAFKPWVYEIAKNACIDQFRRARRAEEVSMDADDGLGSADYGRLVSGTPTPDVAVDHKQQIDHLRGAFGGLSETHHEILVMRELEGLSYREIGEKLGMTRPAVESTLFRARRRLTEEYDELVTGERCARVQQIIATAGGSALGTRDKRRVARHVSYCQPCLRHARVSGMDAGDLVHKPVRQKIAAILPLPAFLKERWGAGEVNASVAQWSMQASSVDPGMLSSWGKAAATAATIVVAGVGAGAATDGSSPLRDGFGGLGLQSITGGGSSGGGSSDATDQRRAGGAERAGQRKAADRQAGAGSRSGKARADARERAAGGTTAGGGDAAARELTPTGAAGGGAGEVARDGADGAAASGGGAAAALPKLDTNVSNNSGSGSGSLSDVTKALPEVDAPATTSTPSTDVGSSVEAIGKQGAQAIDGLAGAGG